MTDAVVALLEPIQHRYTELSRDPDLVRKVLRDGAIEARMLAGARVAAAKRAIGLLPE